MEDIPSFLSSHPFCQWGLSATLRQREVMKGRCREFREIISLLGHEIFFAAFSIRLRGIGAPDS